MFGIDALAEPAAAKRLIAWLPDEPMLYDKLTPMEYLEFVAGLWCRRPRRAAAGRGAAAGARPLGPAEPALRGLLARHEAEGGAGRRADPRPALLILDEPLTGLDAAIARQVKDLLQERVRAGATVILTTHILEVAERIADRIGIITGAGCWPRARWPNCASGPASARRRSRTCFSPWSKNRRRGDPSRLPARPRGCSRSSCGWPSAARPGRASAAWSS